MRLDGKVIVVTGGAGLLGQAFVRSIALEGGFAVLADISEERGERVAATLRAELACDRVVFQHLDITSVASIQELLSDVKRRFGRIDALVNNAYPRSPNYGRKFEDVEFADFCQALSLHIGGYFLTAQQFASFFVKQGFGHVITIASIYGVIAPRFDVYADTPMTMPVEYAVIKSALLHLNRYMTQYFRGKSIRFNSISPGGILDSQPASFVERYKAFSQTKGMLAPADVAGTLVFLLSDESQYITGQNVIVDDGFSA